MRLITEIQFLLVTTFIFPVKLLVLQRSALLWTSLSTIIHCQSLFWRILLLVIRILLKRKNLRREEGITVLLEVNLIKGYL